MKRFANKYIKLGIKSKLIAAITLPMFIVVGILITIHTFIEINMAKKSLVENTHSLILSMMQDFEKVHAFGDQAAAIELSNKLKYFENVEYVLVHSADGSVVYGYHKPDAKYDVLPPVLEQTVDYNADYMTLRSPTMGSAREIGLDYVNIRVSLDELNGLIQRAILVAIMAGMVTIVIGLGFAAVIERLISNPIMELKRTAMSILETRDYSVRAAKYLDDEVGKVTDAFNSMLEQVQENNFVIEQKVEERTSELLASEQRFKQILDSTPDPIMKIDLSGGIVMCNKCTKTAFGYTEAELAGLHIDRLLKDFAASHRVDSDTDYLAFVLSMKGKVVHNQLAVRKDGSSFAVDMKLSTVIKGDEQLIVLSMRDITERKALENQLAQAQKLESIGQLAAGIAHEINTPTQFIGDNTRFLNEAFADLAKIFEVYNQLISAAGQPDDAGTVLALQGIADEVDLSYLLEEIPQAISQTLDGVDRVAVIVRAMKEFSHPGGGEKTVVDLNHAIESTLTVSRNEWKYIADLKTDFEPDLPQISCYPGELNQVFLNIIVNASHAIIHANTGKNEKGLITITTQKDGDNVVIRIEDTGGGIPESIQNKIFDPFFTTKEVGKGTGQGLAIARSVIVDKHGGTIEFKSEVGVGTTFNIKLPISTDSVQKSEIA